MDRNFIKEVIKELFKSGEIQFQISEDETVYNGDLTRITAQVIIDDEIVSESSILIEK